MTAGGVREQIPSQGHPHPCVRMSHPHPEAVETYEEHLTHKVTVNLPQDQELAGLALPHLSLNLLYCHSPAALLPSAHQSHSVWVPEHKQVTSFVFLKYPVNLQTTGNTQLFTGQPAWAGESTKRSHGAWYLHRFQNECLLSTPAQRQPRPSTHRPLQLSLPGLGRAESPQGTQSLE